MTLDNISIPKEKQSLFSWISRNIRTANHREKKTKKQLKKQLIKPEILYQCERCGKFPFSYYETAEHDYTMHDYRDYPSWSVIDGL